MSEKKIGPVWSQVKTEAAMQPNFTVKFNSTHSMVCPKIP